jgi:hypothetical protein
MADEKTQIPSKSLSFSRQHHVNYAKIFVAAIKHSESSWDDLEKSALLIRDNGSEKIMLNEQAGLEFAELNLGSIEMIAPFVVASLPSLLATSYQLQYDVSLEAKDLVDRRLYYELRLCLTLSFR